MLILSELIPNSDEFFEIPFIFALNKIGKEMNSLVEKFLFNPLAQNAKGNEFILPSGHMSMR